MIYERHDGYAPRDGLRRASRGAMIFGVCAGIADRFGLDRTITRIVTVVAGFVFFPAVPIGYVILAILLKKSLDSERETGRATPQYRDKADSSAQAEERQRERFRDLDRRLQRLEEYVTSRRFKLDREFEKLKD